MRRKQKMMGTKHCLKRETKIFNKYCTFDMSILGQIIIKIDNWSD